MTARRAPEARCSRQTEARRGRRGKPPRRDHEFLKAAEAAGVDGEIQQLVDAVEPQTLKGLRDRALLLIGFAGAFRQHFQNGRSVAA